MMSKIDQDCVKKCMEIRVEGRPRRTWLESRYGRTWRAKEMSMTRRNGDEML